MRIGLDVSKVVPPRDGIGTYGAELVRALARLVSDQRGSSILRLHGLIEPYDRVEAEHVLGELGEHVQFADRAPQDDDLDLFHATTLAWPTGFLGPVVVTCFDLTFLTHPECHTLENRLHCIEGMLQATLSQSSLIAISQATAEDLADCFAVPEDLVSVIPIAAGVEWSPSEPDAARLNLDQAGVPDRFFLAVGTREPRKNLARLLDAHQSLSDELRSQVPLVIVGGRGWQADDLEHRLKTTSDVLVLGHVEQALLRDLYSSATAFVYPSLAEGFGLPILEAMACGAPVITSNTSSMPEVAGDAAILVDPLDAKAIAGAMKQLAECSATVGDAASEGLRSERVRRGRAAEFSWQRTARETFDLYQRVAGQSS